MARSDRVTGLQTQLPSLDLAIDGSGHPEAEHRGTRYTAGTHTHTDTLYKPHALTHLESLQQMLIYNPGNRITAKAALRHKYFDDLDKSSLPASSP